MSLKFYLLPLISVAFASLGCCKGHAQQAVQEPAQAAGQPAQTADQPAQTAVQQAGLTPDEQKILTDNAQAANAWLKLIDEGKFGESWDAGSKTFQLTIKRDEWIKAEEKLRKPLGTVVSRKLLQQLPKENPKGLPAGYYMVLIYETDFSNRPKANELLTMVLESDKQWRTLTYQAR